MLETFGSTKFPQVRKFRSRVGEVRPHESFPIDQQTTKPIVLQCFKIDGGDFVGPNFLHMGQRRGAGISPHG